MAHLPQLRLFPYPVQLLIVSEMNKAEEEAEEGKLPRQGLDDEITCACLFYRRYQLPCAHILRHHMIFDHLNEKH